VQSENSIQVVYAGKELTPGTRYYWRVTVWGADGKAYPSSDAAWFETGLMDLKNWKAAWIGYESSGAACSARRGCRMDYQCMDMRNKRPNRGQLAS